MKLFSQKQIWAASFLVTPIVGSLFLRKNFIAMGKKSFGNIIVVLSTIFTILTLLSIVIFDIQLSGLFLPVFFAAPMGLICYLKQSKFINLHRDAGGKFYSSFLIFILLVLFSLLIGAISIYAASEEKRLNNLVAIHEKYDAILKPLVENENKGLKFFDMLNDNSLSNKEIETYFFNVASPVWKKNIEISKSLIQENQGNKNFVLFLENLKMQYSFRDQQFDLFKKSMKDDTQNYQDQIHEINSKIQNLIDDGNKIWETL